MHTMSSVGIADLLRVNATHFPDRVSLLSDDREFTFAESYQRINSVASRLRNLGVNRGTRVALFATDSIEYIEILLACMKLGAVYVPLNYKLSRDELAALLNAAEAQVLFVSHQYGEMVSDVRAAVPTLRLAIGIDFDELDLVYADLLRSGPVEDIRVEVADEDLVGLCFTSGTTTRPKGVLHSQRFTKTLMYQTIIERRIQPGTLHYSAAPLFHVAGMFYCLAGIARGYSSLVLPSFDPAKVVEWMRSGRISGCFLVPTMISSLLQQPAVRHADFSAVTSIAYGGSPMSPSLLQRAMGTFDCDFINMFGAGTEAGFQCILSPEDHKRALAGHPHLLKSIGRPSISVELRLCDDNFVDVELGAVGEIVTRSDGIMSGYLNMPDETDRVLVDGWFRGGDAAWMDAEGYLYLSGRRKDMIIRGGENIYPIEIETILTAFPGVLEAAVIGVQDEHWGEIVCACLVLESPGSFNEAETKAWCRSHLAAFKVPQEFRLYSELPKNASGKVLKRELRQLASTTTR